MEHPSNGRTEAISQALSISDVIARQVLYYIQIYTTVNELIAIGPFSIKPGTLFRNFHEEIKALLSGEGGGGKFHLLVASCTETLYSFTLTHILKINQSTHL